MNRLVLIDGNAILHRAFHALPPLTAPDGTVVNAVYGFAGMLIRLIHDLNPSRVAVAFDRPAPTFRKKLYAGYQVKRPKMDDTLIPQVQLTHDLLAAFRIPVFELDGFEADDVIGTLAARETQADTDTQVIIVTGDRDILQLITDDRVLVYMPTKGLSEAKLYGEKETVERMGVTPSRIPDFKALAGDSSDNYPGIAGIGPKTAVDILRKAGSVGDLYARIDTESFGMSPAVKKKITEGKEDAMLSLELATIRRDVPLSGEIPELTEGQLQTEEAHRQLERFGFHSLIKRISGSAPAKPSKKKETQSREKDKDDSEQLTLM